jgi:hypothetical protein
VKGCRVCGVEKRLEQFPLQPAGRHGRHPVCKPCRAAEERRRYARQRDSILARARTDQRRRARVRWRAVARKYGLTEHEYRALYVAQRACCAVCERRTARLVVDHDHSVGIVRGLLCVNCNFALGELEDDPDRCDAAAAFSRPTRDRLWFVVLAGSATSLHLRAWRHRSCRAPPAAAGRLRHLRGVYSATHGGPRPSIRSRAGASVQSVQPGDRAPPGQRWRRPAGCRLSSSVHAAPRSCG